MEKVKKELFYLLDSYEIFPRIPGIQARKIVVDKKGLHFI